MGEPEREFSIYYWSEVSADVSLIRSGSGTVLAKAEHPSGTGMGNWFHFVDDVSHYGDHVRTSADIDECEDERDAVLTCLTRLADSLWGGLDWKADREEEFDKDYFYRDMLQAFIVGELHQSHGRISQETLPPKALSARSNKE